jgi:hypothetical protein
MNDLQKPDHRKKRCMMITLACAVVVLSVVVFVGWYQPKVFTFYAKVSPVTSNVSGEVFKSSDGVFLVRLDSGSQLTVEVNPPKLFLSPSSKRKGIQVGRYLLLPSAGVGGVDLSKSEGFEKQAPVFGNGKITLKDPLQRDGLFFFPNAD